MFSQFFFHGPVEIKFFQIEWMFLDSEDEGGDRVGMIVVEDEVPSFGFALRLFLFLFRE